MSRSKRSAFGNRRARMGGAVTETGLVMEAIGSWRGRRDREAIRLIGLCKNP